MEAHMSMQYSRRHFLRAALAGGGILGAASLLSVFPAASALALTRGAAGEDAVPLSRTALFMGTLVTISVARCGDGQASEAMERAFALGRRMEGVFTRFAADSPLGMANSAGSLNDVPPELAGLLEVSMQMHRLTDGAFDPTVLPVLRLFENSRAGTAPSVAETREALELVGVDRLHMGGNRLRFDRQGMALTLDGIAKGHIADAMSRELTAAGCPNHCVNAGGDIVVRGSKAGGAPWRVAVEDPGKKGMFPQVVDLTSGGVATSGIYEVFYDAAHDHSHLINPATGQDAAEASVTVAAPDCRTADALATALSVMPPRDALALMDEMPGCACCLVRRDGLIRTSRRWPGRPA